MRFMPQFDRRLIMLRNSWKTGERSSQEVNFRGDDTPTHQRCSYTHTCWLRLMQESLSLQLFCDSAQSDFSSPCDLDQTNQPPTLPISHESEHLTPQPGRVTKLRLTQSSVLHSYPWLKWFHAIHDTAPRSRLLTCRNFHRTSHKGNF